MFRRIASYSLSLYGATLLTSLASFAVTMVVARRIPKEALGLYGFYVGLYSLVGMLLCSGINQALVASLGARPEDRRDVARFALALSGALALILWPAAFLAFLMGSTAWTYGLAAVPFFVLNLLGASVFRADLSRGREVALRVSVSVLNSSLTLGLVFLSSEPALAPLRGDLVSIAIPSLVLAIHFGRLPGPALRDAVHTASARRLLSTAWPLSIAGAAFVVWSNASAFLIRGLAGLAALGEYYFALQLMYVLDKPMQILSNVVLAAFAQEPGIEPVAHRRLVTFNLAAFPLAAAAVCATAPWLLSLADRVLGGAGGEPLAVKYARAPLYLSLFAVAVPFRCVEFLLSSLAIARGNPQASRNTHVIATAISLPLLAFLVQRFGAWGAAMMPLAYQALFLFLQARQLRAGMPEIAGSATRAAVIATILLGAVVAAGSRTSPLWFPLAALAYLGSGQLLGAWDLRLLMPAPPPAEALRSRKSAPAPPSL